MLCASCHLYRFVHTATNTDTDTIAECKIGAMTNLITQSVHNTFFYFAALILRNGKLFDCEWIYIDYIFLWLSFIQFNFVLHIWITLNFFYQFLLKCIGVCMCVRLKGIWSTREEMCTLLLDSRSQLQTDKSVREKQMETAFSLSKRFSMGKKHATTKYFCFSSLIMVWRARVGEKTTLKTL